MDVAATPSPTADTRPQRVLVLGDDTRSFLAVVRGLARQGVEVHVVPSDVRSPALQSRFIRQVHRLPQWLGDGADWLDALEGLLKDLPVNLVIPCNETTLLPLQMNRERFSALACLALPNEEAFAVLFDKAATRNLAVQLEISVSRGRLLRSDDTAHALFAEFGRPIVVKPTGSYRMDSLHRREKVRICSSEGDLQPLLDGADRSTTLVEEFFEGTGLGVSICAQEGVVVQSFEHHRVYEDDGASYYRVSAACDPDRLRAVAAIAGHLRFSGIAMFEFKRNAGKWVLLEVNARPWGSMPLPLALGVNFPFLWFQCLVGAPAPAPPPADYRHGVYGRNLFPDIKAMLVEVRGRPDVAGKVVHTLRRLWDFRRGIVGTEVHDVYVADDPAPAQAELRQFLAEVGSRLVQSVPGHRWVCQLRAQSQVKGALSNGGTIIFVCSGNICRSPFAAHLLRQSGFAALEVQSAGTMPVSGRHSPEFAIIQARAHGVELAQHRSHMVTEAEIEAADLVVIFDQKNRSDLLSRYSNIEKKLLLLGHLIKRDRIIDPIHGDENVFKSNYSMIAQAVARLADCLPAR